jgi:hypothetical protein
MQMAPPKQAKNFMKFQWAGDWFNDDTEETAVK